MQLDQLLAPHAQMSQLLTLSRYWQQLDSIVKHLLPCNLHTYFRIACVQNNTLVVHAYSHVCASRLKMLLPALLPQLQQHDNQIQRIRIKMCFTDVPVARQKNFRISPTALGYFERTAQQLAHHPQLAHALQQSVKNNQ